jgi:hypothetical protein
MGTMLRPYLRKSAAAHEMKMKNMAVLEQAAGIVETVSSIRGKRCSRLLMLAPCGRGDAVIIHSIIAPTLLWNNGCAPVVMLCFP